MDSKDVRIFSTEIMMSTMTYFLHLFPPPSHSHFLFTFPTPLSRLLTLPSSFSPSDIAIAAPYGGEDKKGIVYIFNGRPTGLNAVPSQILEGKWAARSMPPSFGYSMKGATDIDKNGYPGAS